MPCQSRIFVLAFHPPRLEGNLDFFNAQACLSPKAYSSRCLGLTRCHVCLDSRSLFSAAFGHTSLSCYLDDSTVNSLLQEDFWRKEGIKKHLMDFVLAVENVFTYENRINGNLSQSVMAWEKNYLCVLIEH